MHTIITQHSCIMAISVTRSLWSPSSGIVVVHEIDTFNLLNLFIHNFIHTISIFQFQIPNDKKMKFMVCSPPELDA